jgi:tetratricopeptide (TPR) repeat protein
MYDPAGRQHRGPLVGREEELGELYAQFEMIERLTGQEFQANRFDVLARRPYGVFLLGEAGIGKTRLAEEMASWAQQRGWAVIWNRAYEQEQVVPYWLWSKMLRACLQLDLWKPEEEDSPTLFMPLVKLLPELAEYWSTDENLLAAPSEQEPFLLWEAVLAVCKSMSRTVPVLLALDDVQWADEGSCKLLGYLLRRLVGSRVLVLGTCRQEEFTGSPLEPLIGHLQRERLVTTLHVHALPNAQIQRLLCTFPGDFSDAVIQHIQRQAAGNPFFTEELARSASMDTEPRLPKSIAAALGLRLERLSPACQHLLSKAAVLGNSFDVNLISTLEENMSPRTPEGKKPRSAANEDLFDLLEEALQAGILTEAGVGAHITFSFWHPLMVTHLYENLSAARRRKLHRQVAKVLQQVHAERQAEQAAIITHHLLKAGADAQDIVYYAEMAGDHAYALSSYPEAEKHYRIVLESLKIPLQGPIDPSAGTDSLDGRLSDEHTRLAELLELLGECASIQGKYEEARRIYEQVLHFRQQQIGAKNSEEYQREAQIRALLWCEIGRTWYDVGKNDRARECYRRSEEILQNAGVVAGVVWAYIRYRQAYAGWLEASYNEASAIAYEALNLFEEAFEPLENNIGNITRSTLIRRILAGDPISMARTRALLGMIANGAGRSTEALQQYTLALELYEQYDSKRDIASVCCNLGDLQLRKADYESGQAFFKRSQQVAEQIGDSPLVAFIFGNLGVIEMQQGNLVEAENEFKQGIALTERVNDSLHFSMWYAYLSSVLLDQGKIAEANPVLCRAWKFGRTMHILPYIGLAQVVLGEMRIAQAIMIDLEESKDRSDKEKIRTLEKARRILLSTVTMKGLEAETRTEGRVALGQALLLLRDVEQAQNVVMQALEEAQQCELMWLIARAQRVLGSIYAAQQKREQAVCCFEQALDVFRETGMRLEYGRTLLQYGEALVRWEGCDEEEYRRGLGYVREAGEVFEECGARLDLRVVEKMLDATE